LVFFNVHSQETVDSLLRNQPGWAAIETNGHCEGQNRSERARCGELFCKSLIESALSLSFGRYRHKRMRGRLPKPCTPGLGTFGESHQSDGFVVVLHCSVFNDVLTPHHTTPQLLFMDGAAAHVNEGVLEVLENEYNTEVVILLANTRFI
jgi:hypothetical protein